MSADANRGTLCVRKVIVNNMDSTLEDKPIAGFFIAFSMLPPKRILLNKKKTKPPKHTMIKDSLRQFGLLIPYNL